MIAASSSGWAARSFMPAAGHRRPRLARALSLTAPSAVRIVEVGPRDGLQNEKSVVATDDKIRLILDLEACGLRSIEATAFVSPKWVPQMSDHQEIMRRLKGRASPASFPVLTPNLQGYENAVAAGAKEVAIFAAASETFSKKNINCTIAESLERFRPVTEAAAKDKVKVRGYVSCVLGCPFQGPIAPSEVARVSEALLALGAYEISLGDTIGIGSPGKTREMLRVVKQTIASEKLAVHFHDTYGQALANILVGLDEGIAVVDSSVAGLGGCPYSPGATGNVATEDVVFMLQGLGVECGVDLDRLVSIGEAISNLLVRKNASRAATAILSAKKRQQLASKA